MHLGCTNLGRFVTFALMKRRGAILAALLLVLLFVVCLFPRCARQVALSGGVRDTIAPYIVRASPPSGTTYFKGKRIRLTFNEYVALKDAQKEIYFSPPFRWPYATLLQGRSLVFEIADTLRADVTYRLQLGKAIQDLTENNPYVNAHYCFSTGAQIDSGYLAGRVRDALLHKPLAGIKVMLYTENRDSVVNQQMPDYVTVSDAQGLFVFDNLPIRSFKLFALEDANTNYRYDLPKEFVAFSDSLVHSYQFESDSLRRLPKLNLFSYSPKPLALLSATRTVPEQIRLIFSAPTVDSVSLLSLQNTSLNCTRESSLQGDTLIYWLQDAGTVLQDTLLLSLRYKTGSEEQREWRTDTLRLAYSFPQQEAKTLHNMRRVLPDSLLRISAVWQTAGVRSTDSLRIKVSSAVQTVDTKKFLLLQDTVSYPLSVFSSTTSTRELLLKGELRPRKHYRVRILPEAVRDFFGRTNDTIDLTVTTLNPSQYAILHLTFQNAPERTVVQVLTADEKKSIVRSIPVPRGANRLSIPYLPPNNYELRIVDDQNANGQWDTGNYWQHLQPESVRYYRNEKQHATVTVRANWEYDIHIDYNKLEE